MSEAERAGTSRQDKSGRLLAGRYRLGEVLGRGGMGTVWRADDETLGRTVAVKELRFPSNIDDDEKRRLITRTLREAKAIARIRNNSAVTVFDVVDEDDRPWIVMELVEGKSLAEVIREDGLLEPKRAAEVGLAILDVLRSAHREGILHRDVKPSNVLISDDGRVVLTDFGIAQVEGDPSITSTGMLVGAPSYISPERARGHKPGPAADLWSLGGLLYASVEGVPPYDRGSAIATLTAVMTEPLEEPKNAGPLRNVIYGLLNKDPAKRLDDAGARAMLDAVLHAPAPEVLDATRVVPLPAQPGEPAAEGDGRGRSGSGGKRGGEAAEKLRGALRTVREAAGAATAAAAAKAKTTGGQGTTATRPGGTGATATGASSASGGVPGRAPGGAGSTGSAGAGGTGGTSGTGVPGGKGATAAMGAIAAGGGAGAGRGRGTGAVRAGGPAAAGSGSGTGGGQPSSGWPVMPAPDLPPRSAPRAPLTDVVPRRTLVIIALVVVLAVVGVILAFTLGGGDDKDSDNAGGGGAKAGTSASASAGTKEDKSTGTGTSTDGSASASASTGSGSGTDASASENGSPDDDSASGDSGDDADDDAPAVSTHQGGRYSIGLPAGWKYGSHDSAGDRFTGPDGQKLLVAWTTTPKNDPVADWENQERDMVRPQYQKIRIEKVDYRGWNTADWEFTYVDGGTKYRTVDRGFVVSAHAGYALMYTAKAADWQEDVRKATWKTLTESFEPKS